MAATWKQTTVACVDLDLGDDSGWGSAAVPAEKTHPRGSALGGHASGVPDQSDR